MNLTQLRSVTPEREKEFKKLNINSVEDLIKFYPRNYLDLTKRVSIRETFHNEMALVSCRLTGVAPVRYTGRVKYLRAYLEQDGYVFSALWFNMPYLASRLKEGEYLFYGRVRNEYGQVTIVNPTFEPLEKNARLKGLIPVYTLRGSLTQRAVRTCVSQALQVCTVESVIPEELQMRYGLSSLREAYEQIHAPKTEKEQKKAAERIALEEFFVLVSAFKLIKGDKNEARTHKYAVTEAEVAQFEKRFPFAFTGGQQRAVRDIYDNLTAPVRMNRLLQGDVGSGKTAVALTAIFMAVKSGYQAVYLSPTEVLAAQNYALLQKAFPDYNVGYLAGGCTAAEKRKIKSQIQTGVVDILCGTHAVLQKDVAFSSLALCVCDEQHRFGVAQRNILSEKGDGIDVLVMSATPIPRTLSLIFYGDLDITTITEKPKNRQEISTSIIPQHRYDDMLEYIRREAHAGKQAYFVCTRIDDDEGQNASVTELHEELTKRLPDVRFALLHGRMKDAEKAEIMAAFKRKEYDSLVSTTVIEVGVDVPDATIMVIMNAERFGLSQLHQLRGRVGRGSEKSYCFLLVGSESESALERLTILKTTTDGFRLAEKDLELRGSGDFFGMRQSGRFLNEIRNLHYTTEVIFTAKKLSDEAFAKGLNRGQITRAAILKYESLKNVVLN